MKKTIAILLISLMLFTSGCAVMTAAAPEPTPAPPTVEELLADALKYYNAGNYEAVSYTHLTLPTILRV